MHDHVGIALSSLAGGAGAGAATVSAGVLVFRIVPPPTGGADLPHLILQTSVLTGIVLGAAVGWRLAAPLPDPWRRGVTAALAAFAGLLLAALTVPVDMLAGPVGLAGYAAVMAAVAFRGRRAARRAGPPSS